MVTLLHPPAPAVDNHADVTCLCGRHFRVTPTGLARVDACDCCANTGQPCPAPDRHLDGPCECGTEPDLIHCDHASCADPARLDQPPCCRGHRYCCGCCHWVGYC